MLFGCWGLWRAGQAWTCFVCNGFLGVFGGFLGGFGGWFFFYFSPPVIMSCCFVSFVSLFFVFFMGWAQIVFYHYMYMHISLSHCLTLTYLVLVHIIPYTMIVIHCTMHSKIPCHRIHNLLCITVKTFGLLPWSSQLHACCVCDTLQTLGARGYQSHSESECNWEGTPYVNFISPFRRLIAFLMRLVFLWSYTSAPGGVPWLHGCGRNSRSV